MESSKNRTAVEQLKTLVRQKSALALSAMSQKSDLKIEELSKSEKVMGHWMSLISVSGDQIHLTFKIQFSVEMARIFAQQTFKHVSHGISNSHSKDFVRELCNMVAGYLKTTLIHNKINVGVSLPLLCRGFDNFFFDAPSQENSGMDAWKLVHNGTVMYCSTVIELMQDLKLEDLSETSEATGDVEFL